MGALEPAVEGLDEGLGGTVRRTFSALQARGIASAYVPNRQVALERVLRMIPKD